MFGNFEFADRSWQLGRRVGWLKDHDDALCFQQDCLNLKSECRVHSDVCLCH